MSFAYYATTKKNVYILPSNTKKSGCGLGTQNKTCKSKLHASICDKFGLVHVKLSVLFLQKRACNWHDDVMSWKDRLHEKKQQEKLVWTGNEINLRENFKLQRCTALGQSQLIHQHHQLYKQNTNRNLLLTFFPSNSLCEWL